MSSRRIRLMDGGFSRALKDKDYNVDVGLLWLWFLLDEFEVLKTNYRR